MQEIYVWPYKQVVYAQPGIHTGERDTQTLLGFWDANDYLISARRPNLEIFNNKKESLPNSGLCNGPHSKIKRKWKPG